MQFNKLNDIILTAATCVAWVKSMIGFSNPLFPEICEFSIYFLSNFILTPLSSMVVDDFYNNCILTDMSLKSLFHSLNP